jgi:quinol monooxygenase YgiN
LIDANFAGSHSIKIFASIEDPSRVILIVEWDSVEAHTQHRGTPAHNRMREANTGYQTAKSDGAHYLLHEIRVASLA